MRCWVVLIFGGHLLVASPVAAQEWLRDRVRLCEALLIDMLQEAAIASVRADACGDLQLKVRQARLAINIAVAIGVDEGAAVQSFTKEYARASPTNKDCDFDQMIEDANTFHDTGERIMDYCAIIAP